MFLIQALIQLTIKLIQEDEMTYLTSMKLSSSADKIIEKFEKDKAELIDSEKGIYGIKILKPNSIKYFCFSEALQEKNSWKQRQELF